VEDLLASWTYSALCLTNFFHGLALGESPVMSNLIGKAFDWALGLIKPKPPLTMG